MTDKVEQHILNRYKLLKKVGSGAYGHVWKVQEIQTGKQWALKKIFDAFQHSTDAQRTFRQITLLHQLCHPHIIKLHYVYPSQNDKDLYLVFEYMEADLHNAIGQHILKDLHQRYAMYQVIEGVKYLHDSNIIHRDLKPSNLLINSDCSVKICDLGLARTIDSKNQRQQQENIFTEQVATRWYRAPQVLLGSQKYNQSADLWSVGCILAQVLIGKPFFPGNSTLNQLQRIVCFTGMPSQSDVESLESSLAFTMMKSVTVTQKYRNPQEWFMQKGKQGYQKKCQAHSQAIDLITKLLKFNPKDRLSAQEALRHPYISQFLSKQGKSSEKQIPQKIYSTVSERSKKSVKQYKRLMYEWISQKYPRSTLYQSSKQKLPLKQYGKGNSAQKSHSNNFLQKPSYSSASKDKVNDSKYLKGPYMKSSKYQAKSYQNSIKQKQNYGESINKTKEEKATSNIKNSGSCLGQKACSTIETSQYSSVKVVRCSSQKSLKSYKDRSRNQTANSYYPVSKTLKDYNDSYDIARYKKSQPCSPVSTSLCKSTFSWNKLPASTTQNWKSYKRNISNGQVYEERQSSNYKVNKAVTSNSIQRLQKINSSCSIASSSKNSKTPLQKKACSKKRYANCLINC